MVDPGSNNTFNQQYRLLHQKGYCDPDPCSQFVTNIIQVIKTWRNQNKAVLVCIDANENPQKQSTDGITRIFTETDLTDLHSHRQKDSRPPTYNRGSKPIDLCAGSPEFVDALIAAWYLPFGEPLGLRGDHRTLGMDFNIETLFRQNASTANPTIQRGVNSNNTKLVQNFCKTVIEECHTKELYERIHSLTSQSQLTTKQHVELDNIDQDLTKILITADQKCVKQGTSPWSPQLHEAYLIHHYWTLKLSFKRTGRNYPQAFSKIEEKVPRAKLHPPHLHTITANLREAQKNLQSIHKEALEKHQAHLDDLVKAAHTCKDQKRNKLILCLKRAEELK